MTKNNTYKSIILFILIFCLSIGYAVVNSVSLSITGNATSATKNLDVEFTSSTTVSNTSKASASASGHTAYATATDLTLNETISFGYYIINNEEDVNSQVTITIPAPTEYFEITITPQKPYQSSISSTLNNEDEIVRLATTGSTTKTYTIPKKFILYFKINVTMIKTPITEQDSSFNFQIDIDAQPATETV